MKKALIFAILTYKKLISPLLKPSCRFHPCCSDYSIEAIEKYGVIKGIFVSGGRLLRCNQYFKGGFDPVR